MTQSTNKLPQSEQSEPSAYSKKEIKVIVEIEK